MLSCSEVNQVVPAQPLSIVMACDEGYAMPLASALRSMAESNPSHWPLNVYILYDSFSEHIKNKVIGSIPNGSIQLVWLPITLHGFSSFATHPHVSRMTFARFLLSNLLPDALTRILYLDADILVLGDLGALWASDLHGCCVGAVVDHGLDPLLQRQDAKCRGMPLVHRYFNAGVMLIDLTLWRQQHVGERASQYLVDHPCSPFADQDALNHVLNHNWHSLADGWNFQGHRELKLSSVIPECRPPIIHFVTGAKPWKREYRTPNEVFYNSFRERTQFPRTLWVRLGEVWSVALFQLKKSLRGFLRPPRRTSF